MNSYIYSFESNFIVSPDSTPVVLYGLGKQTEEILSQCKDERIIGLLDGFREEGFFCGKSILALQDLAGMSVKIIIVARAASERVIYKRIREFCQENSIPVYNLSGEELGKPREGRDHLYFTRNAEELLELAEAYATVSFDIFDTLLTRKISDREILYSMVAKAGNGPTDFAKARLAAEFELSAKGCPTLAEIYDKVQEKCRLSEREKKCLRDVELVIEAWNLTPREEMVRIFKALLTLGKRVYLISDMYFSKEYLKTVLENCGVSGYQELFVSCEYGINKENGLFDAYRKKVNGVTYLHIGDSEEADGASAQQCGVATYLVKSAVDMAGLTELEDVSTRNLPEEVLQNLIYAQLFRSPFALAGAGGRVHMKDYYAVGYSLLGPIMVGFTQWLFSRVQGSTLDKICFISRDGYLFKRVYELLASHKDNIPKAIYLETSRRLNVVAMLRNEEDIHWALQFPYAGTAQERLVKQLGLARDMLLTREDGEDDDIYLQRHKDILLDNARQVRANYKKYLERFDIQEDTTAMFDFVSTGTCQVGIESLLGFPMQGLYFDRLNNGDARKSNLRVRAYVHEVMPGLEMNQYFMLENWVKEITPSVKEISSDGQVIHGESHMSAEQIKAIHLVQQGTLDFCRDMLYLSEHGMETDMQEWALKWLNRLNEEHFCLEDMHWPIFDEFTGRQI